MSHQEKYFHEIANKINRAHTRITTLAQKRSQGVLTEEEKEEYRTVIAELNRLLELLPMAGGIEKWKEKTQHDDPEAIEAGLAFLEAQTYHFHSGYLKETILRKLKKATLTEKQKERVREIILGAIKGPYFFIEIPGKQKRFKREFYYYARLARVYANEDLLKQFSELANNGKTLAVRAKALFLKKFLENSNLDFEITRNF